MLRGLYQAATGMLAQELRQEVVSNNLANVNSSGYKSQAATMRSFPEVLLYRLHENSATPIGYHSHGVMLDRTYSNWDAGMLEETGVTTHLALMEAGAESLPSFFAVQGAAGEVYTRNGEFRVDGDGFLVTAEGYTVQGQYGLVYVGGNDFTVDSTGQVIIAGEVVDQLRVVTFADPALLQRQGNSLFIASAGVQPLEAANYQVRQGWLEKANVDVTRELVDILAIMRAYEANHKVIQAVDQTLAKSVNEIGSLR